MLHIMYKNSKILVLAFCTSLRLGGGGFLFILPATAATHYKLHAGSSKEAP